MRLRIPLQRQLTSLTPKSYLRFISTASASQSSPKWTPKPFQTTTLQTHIQPLLQDSAFLHSYSPIFQFLTGLNLLKLGQQVHGHMAVRGLSPDAFLAAKMVAFYASSGELDSAEFVFFKVRVWSVLLCNAMIRGYTSYGVSEKALEVFARMHLLGLCADNFTLPFVLKSCAELGWDLMGKSVHGESLRLGLLEDMYVATSLIDMYVKCGEIGNARKVFDEIPVRDIAAWNSLIAGYMKDGDIEIAVELFDRMPCSNIVSWTAMISGFAQNGLDDRALSLFDKMCKEGSDVKPNWVTIMSVLPSCAHSAALERGRWIHGYAKSIGLGEHSHVQTALVAMYAKCGSLVESRRCFDSMRKRNLVAWNTLINAYASHGRGAECVSTFEDMIRSGVRPDSISFTGLLSGCSHSGLTDFGLRYFNCMKSVYSVDPKHEHYACVVDLMARAGRLAEALSLIKTMPMEGGPSIWGALLSACRSHRNLEIAEVAARKLFTLEPECTGNYVLLSNMYAEKGMWDDVNNLRAILKLQGLKKNPGCSWIEVNGTSTLFFGGDTSHPQTTQIYALLEELPRKIKNAGYTYAPDTSLVLHDISDEEKLHNLTTHSEKLAIGFGLLNTPCGQTLRVTKNLRICGDCHTFTKLVSSLYGRVIIIRDVNRFHHFRNGTCSCGDYW
ncbi:unnamed protein product [Rhodiola kirilowii]